MINYHLDPAANFVLTSHFVSAISGTVPGGGLDEARRWVGDQD